METASKNVNANLSTTLDSSLPLESVLHLTKQVPGWQIDCFLTN